MLDPQDLRTYFHWTAKSKTADCKKLSVCTKNEENFEKFLENFEIVRSKSLWKIDFFYNNFSDFGGGGG